MNDLDKAKSRDIVDVLSEYGHSFAKETGNYFMYYSMLPGREGEAHPSFMVKKSTGKWRDPGYKDMPKGGDVIDLVRIFPILFNTTVSFVNLGVLYWVNALK